MDFLRGTTGRILKRIIHLYSLPSLGIFRNLPLRHQYAFMSRCLGTRTLSPYSPYKILLIWLFRYFMNSKHINLFGYEVCNSFTKKQVNLPTDFDRKYMAGRISVENRISPSFFSLIYFLKGENKFMMLPCFASVCLFVSMLFQFWADYPIFTNLSRNVKPLKGTAMSCVLISCSQ
jgi:hypothetical protein